ncbi:hypothetical protein ACFRAM_28565 [Paenibacillus sp. NPDC056722]|uniref:hypothetical protein n=1 Tax=Paenibacillus sp. NPDC056722 TaxID=3345924 RepID=UPI0036815042
MNAERDWHVEALRLRRERYAPGTRALFALLDGTCAPGTVTRYYAIGEGLLGVTLDNGDTWLIAASRAYVLAEEENALVDGGGSEV